jgi:2,3-bisphosphoglycerate-dependent phosphoglycerate mutase
MCMTISHDAPKNQNQQVLTGKLLLVRHAESEWNVLSKWTGRENVNITAKGQEEAKKIGEALQDIELHHTYSSKQIRTFQTLTHILEGAAKSGIPHIHSAELNERDYGDYTGLNKWEVLEQLGEDTFTRIRRSWDEPIPNGETLEMVHQRAVPYFTDHILPKLREGKNVLVVSHGNTIRSLIKYLEDISPEGIAEVEMPFGHVLLYTLTDEGKHHSKELRIIDTTPPNA